MSKRNKAREIWLDRYRSALVQACGAAAILGFTDHAATLCEMIDAARVDSRQQTGDKNALTRAQKCAIIKKGYQAACAPQNQKLQESKKMMEMTFAQMLDLLGGYATDAEMDMSDDMIEDAARWTLADGSTIRAYSLGRDGGFEIVGRDASGAEVCYVCTDGGFKQTGEDLDAIADAIRHGAETLEGVFSEWDNGLGGDPFDLDYLPDYLRSEDN